MKRHIIQCLVENKSGVLARIASLFSARGFNIKSLAVGETHDPTMSCVTMVVGDEDPAILEQIQKQLNKLIDVIIVKDLTTLDHVERELLLFRVDYNEKTKEAVDKLNERFNFHMYDIEDGCAILEFTGGNEQVKELTAELSKSGIKELIKTGKIAIAK